MKERFSAALLGAAAGAVIAYPKVSFDAAKAGLSAFCVSVLPALLPLLTLMLLLSSRVKRSLPLLVPMSLLCGSPGGARLLSPLCMDKKTALLCAAMSGTMSPMFFLGTLPAWLDSPSVGLPLLLAHAGAAVACGGCVQLFFRPKKTRILPTFHAETPLPMTVGQAALSAANAMLTACVCVTLGFVLSALLSEIVRGTPPVSAALSVLIEVTGGAKKLCALPLSRPLLLCLLSFSCAFGGLSIQLQNAAFLSERGVKLPELFLMGLLRGAFACALCYLLTFVFR